MTAIRLLAIGFIYLSTVHRLVDTRQLGGRPTSDGLASAEQVSEQTWQPLSLLRLSSESGASANRQVSVGRHLGQREWRDAGAGGFRLDSSRLRLAL